MPRPYQYSATRRSDRASAAHSAAPLSGPFRGHRPGRLLSKTGTVYTFVYPRKKKQIFPTLPKEEKHRS